jgi:large subunit ribosomal protein L24
MPKENRAVVSGRQRGPPPPASDPGQEGGIMSKEAPIHLSNIALRDPKDGKATRVGFRR